VEDGRVLFGPGRTALARTLLAVPQDAHAWDLVDAFGLALTGLPPARPAQTPIRPLSEDPAKLARSYATQAWSDPEKAPPPHVSPSAIWGVPGRITRSGAVWHSGPNSSVRAPDYRRRAAGYATRPR